MLIGKYIQRMMLCGTFFLTGNLISGGDYAGSNKSELVPIIELPEVEVIADVPAFRNLEKLIKYDSSFCSEKIRAPKYRLKKEMCAEYSRRAAKKLYGKDHSRWVNSWNLRYHNKIVHQIDSANELKNLALDTILKPGMLVGFYCPNSKYNKRRDETKKRRKYTHISLYIGTNREDLFFLHQKVKKIEKTIMK